MNLARQLLYGGDNWDGAIPSQAQTFLGIVTTRKRKAHSATIPWDVYLHYAGAEELPEVCVELREMITDVQAKWVLTTSIKTGTIPTSLKSPRIAGVS